MMQLMERPALADQIIDPEANLPARVQPAQTVPLRFTSEEVTAIRKTVANQLDDYELAIFLNACRRSGLNPLLREVYGLKMNGKLVIQVGIDGFRKVAHNSGRITGEEGPYYAGPDGEWTRYWLGDDPPVAARYVVHLADRSEPVERVILFKEFRVESNPNWKSRPVHMLGIRAEAHCKRAACPNEMALLELDDSAPTAPATIREERPQNRALPASNGSLDALRKEAFGLYSDLGGKPGTDQMAGDMGQLLGRAVKSLAHLNGEDWRACIAAMKRRIEERKHPTDDAPPPPDQEAEELAMSSH